ncbi:hypothetical protein [Paenibacillus stellifer]|uniref:hypothetical protein n=1 Tax=Paenibacillus stellifer TaxID=169760 RepID=UPI00146FE5AC|nr:hypothetical protein [Paenibacillus stellifer]
MLVDKSSKPPEERTKSANALSGESKGSCRAGDPNDDNNPVEYAHGKGAVE